MNAPKPTTVEDYFATFTDKSAVTAMQAVRAAIRDEAPDAVESIGYGIPTYKQNSKVLVHFGGFKTHIGLYATPTGHAEFSEELNNYKQGKGSVQFPLDTPMPLELIRRIVRFRLREVSGKK